MPSSGHAGPVGYPGETGKGSPREPFSQGTFAPIRFSVVRLVGIERNVLPVENVNILDRQSFLEIKPYSPECDEHPAV